MQKDLSQNHKIDEDVHDFHNDLQDIQNRESIK